MPESDEKRDLGGLARSIDALFSERQPPSAGEDVAEDTSLAAADRPEVATDDSVTAAPSDSEPDLPVDAGGEQESVDPFESFDAAGAEAVPATSEPGLSFSGIEVEEEVVWQTVEESRDDAEGPISSGPPPLPDLPEESARTLPPPLPDLVEEPVPPLPPPLPETSGNSEVGEPLGSSESSEPAERPPLPESTEDRAASTPPPLPELAAEPELASEPEGPTDRELEEAVDAFLAGHPHAGKEVERIAAGLRERLALDPLADAAERLVDASEGDDDDPALEMAAKIVNPGVASRLVQRMAQSDDEGRRAEYVVLADRLGIVMANAFKGALTDAPDARTRRACHEGLIAMGDTSRPVIEAMVEDDNRFLVRSGIAILGEVGGEGALELVTSALADTDFRVRREALGALAKLGDEESSQLVMASLEDSDATVRAAAAEAAGRMGLERALRPMLALLEDEDLDDEEKIPVQVQTLHGLGYLGDPGAVQAIEKLAVGSLFSKPSTEVRVAAYQALHEIGTPHARQVIEKARDDKDPVVRTTARGLSSE